MKQLLKPAYLPWLTLIAGAMGLLLRLWLYATGVDETGLLVTGHPAETLVWLLSIAVMALLLLGTTSLVAAPKYQFNFPPSIFGAVGCGLAALCIAIISVTEVMNNSDTLVLICGVLGLFAAASLVVLALLRFQGTQPNVLFHAIVCMYFMLRLVSLYRHWSADPQLQDYCFQLLATVFLMLSTYYRATFDVHMGFRRPLVICHLAAVYFGCLCLTERTGILFYLATGIWMFTDLCSLAPLPPQTQEDA